MQKSVTQKRSDERPTMLATNNLEAFWMPYSANRQFKKAPRMLVRAEGMHYWNAEGRQLLDGTSGLCAAMQGTVGNTSPTRCTGS
jgi:beta-alanine--pyruvate transaminase